MIFPVDVTTKWGLKYLSGICITDLAQLTCRTSLKGRIIVLQITWHYPLSFCFILNLRQFGKILKFVVRESTATITDSYFGAIKLKWCKRQRVRSCEKYAVHVNRIQILALQRRIHKGEFTGRELSSNPARGWIYTRGTRKERCWGRGWRARGIAIGGHSSIRGINTLELMKAPREQQASGRNVNRDRPASDPFSCTANSQGPHLSPSLAPFTLLCCPLHIRTRS